MIFPYCNGLFSPEIEGFLSGYRLANSNLSTYVLYGYPTQPPAKSVSVGPAPANSPAAGRLVNILWGGGSELPEATEPNVTLTAATGSPAATTQTPLTQMDYLLADVPLPMAGSAINQYSITSTTFPSSLFGWQLFIPE